MENGNEIHTKFLLSAEIIRNCLDLCLIHKAGGPFFWTARFVMGVTKKLFSQTHLTCPRGYPIGSLFCQRPAGRNLHLRDPRLFAKKLTDRSICGLVPQIAPLTVVLLTELTTVWSIYWLVFINLQWCSEHWLCFNVYLCHQRWYISFLHISYKWPPPSPP